MSRRALWAILLLIAVLALAACDRPPGVVDGPGVDFGDPEVGGGAGVEMGPQTSVPTATATHEASPRQGAAGTPIALPPTATPTSPLPTEPPATEQPAPPTPPPTETPPTPTETPPTPTETPPTAPPEPTAAPAEATSAGERIHVVQPGENLYRIGLIYGLSWVAIAEYNGIGNPNQITVGQELRIPPSPTPTLETTDADQSPTVTQGGDEAKDAGAGQESGGEGAGGTAEQAGEVSGEAIVEASGGNAGNPADGAGGGELAAGEGAGEQTAGGPAVVALGPPTHTVAVGETVYSISRRYGIDWAQLAEANGLSAPNQIFAGQVLKIPVDVPGPTPEFNHRVHAGETLIRIAAQYGLPVAALAEANGLTAPYVIYPGQMLVIPGD
jgi:LysM repeat protein